MPLVNPSRPVYTGLHPAPGATANVIVAQGKGLAAVVDLYAQANVTFRERSTFFYTAESKFDVAGNAQLSALRARTFPDVPALSSALTLLLDNSKMGTAIYVSGSASFIGEIARVAALYGITFASLQTDCRGGVTQRVQCVHCKTTAEHPIAATVVCAGCKRRLVVRDHYAQRLNAYMGVATNLGQGT